MSNDWDEPPLPPSTLASNTDCLAFRVLSEISYFWLNRIARGSQRLAPIPESSHGQTSSIAENASSQGRPRASGSDADDSVEEISTADMSHVTAVSAPSTPAGLTRERLSEWNEVRGDGAFRPLRNHPNTVYHDIATVATETSSFFVRIRPTFKFG